LVARKKSKERRDVALLMVGASGARNWDVTRALERKVVASPMVEVFAVRNRTA
jgi:hypothetical protein